MELFVTAIRASACSAVYWEEEAETGGAVRSRARLAYSAVDEKGKNLTGEQTLLSLKDICALDLIPRLLKAGVYSLKIEGRMKRPEYTAGVVRIYRKYVDQYLQYGEENYKVAEADRRELLLLFNQRWIFGRLL